VQRRPGPRCLRSSTCGGHVPCRPIQAPARYAEALETQLGANDRAHLATIIARRPDPADFEFRVTDVQRRLGLSQPGATGITNRLLEAGAIRRTRVQGKSTYYVPIGDARIAFGTTSEGEPGGASQPVG
jgi:hypothetical protein